MSGMSKIVLFLGVVCSTQALGEMASINFEATPEARVYDPKGVLGVQGLAFDCVVTGFSIGVRGKLCRVEPGKAIRFELDAALDLQSLKIIVRNVGFPAVNRADEMYLAIDDDYDHAMRKPTAPALANARTEFDVTEPHFLVKGRKTIELGTQNNYLGVRLVEIKYEYRPTEIAVGASGAKLILKSPDILDRSFEAGSTISVEWEIEGDPGETPLTLQYLAPGGVWHYAGGPSLDEEATYSFAVNLDPRSGGFAWRTSHAIEALQLQFLFHAMPGLKVMKYLKDCDRGERTPFIQRIIEQHGNDCYLAAGWLDRTTTLSLGGRGFGSGLSYVGEMTQLQSLDMSSSEIVDVSPLAALKELTTLVLSNNRIQDITPLRALENLKEVKLANNQIEDLEGLAGSARSLRTLDVASNQLRSLRGLGLTSAELAGLSVSHRGNYLCASGLGFGESDTQLLPNGAGQLTHSCSADGQASSSVTCRDGFRKFEVGDRRQCVHPNAMPRTEANGLGSKSIHDVVVIGRANYVATSGGLSISTNGGESYVNRSRANGLGSHVVNAVHVVGSTVYAATLGGLSISTDGGATFRNRTVADGLGGNEVWGIFATGYDVYAATWRGLGISNTGGTSFRNKTPADGLGDIRVNSVFAQEGRVYAATMGGLSISTDRGASFTNRTVANGLGSNAVRDVVAVGDTIYAATTGGLSISRDGGQTFTNRTFGTTPMANDIYDVAISGTWLYVATMQGAHGSADGGATFRSGTTGSFIDFQAVALAPTFPGVLAATRNGLTFFPHTW